MFSVSRDDKSRQWDNLVNRYIALHKYVKEVGKTAITQSRTGHVSAEVQIKLTDAFRQLEATLSQLKEIFKPCFKDVDVPDCYPREAQAKTLREENEALKLQVAELQREKLALRSELELLQLQKEVESSQQQICDPETTKSGRGQLDGTLKTQSDLKKQDETATCRNLNVDLRRAMERVLMENDYSRRTTVRLQSFRLNPLLDLQAGASETPPPRYSEGDNILQLLKPEKVYKETVEDPTKVQKFNENDDETDDDLLNWALSINTENKSPKDDKHNNERKEDKDNKFEGLHQGRAQK